MVNQVGSVSAKIILDTSEFEDAIEALRDDVKTIRELFNQKTSGKGLSDDVKKLKQEIKDLRSTTEDYKKQLNSLREQLSNGGKSFRDITKETKTLKSALEELNNVKIRPKGLETLQNTLKKLTLDFKRDAKEIEYYISKFNGTGIGLSQSETFSMTLRALANYRKELMSTTNIFSKFNQAQLKSWTENAKLNETYAETSGHFKRQQQNLSYLTTGYNKLTNSILRTTEILTKFDFALMEGVGKESIFYQRTVQLASAMHKLNAQGTSNWSGRQAVGGYSNYISNITEITNQLERQRKATENVTKSTKSGQVSMREFGTAMGSAEKYSNSLYRNLQKVRSVIISVKTIVSAMGAMALWGFATDLIEGAKQTYQVKSEMESLLKQNENVSAGGIKIFNNELDKTIDKFQKINKYSLGETAASIGLEFNLSAKEMAESLDVIAMVQNEYARAGRTSEEAALAVKDILQGEFRRLSMETGIGEEELTGKYGWSGEKEDILGLLEALKKAGKDRHWDLFAAKATSVSDVINITKSRFSEFGADLITTVEPAIVSSFNFMVGAIDGLKSAFESMGSFGQTLTIGGGFLGAFTGISTALMILKRNMGLAEIATLGWGRSFGTALMGLNKTDVALHGFWKTLTATISGTEAATVANMGLKKSLTARLLGVNMNTAAEQGLFKALVESRMALKGESMVMDFSAASTLNFRQKLTYLISDMSLADAKTAGWGKSLKAVITSTKLLKIAVLGLTSIALISWFASVAQWADNIKKKISVFNDMLENGQDRYNSAKKTVEDYTEKISKLTKGTEEYNQAVQNRAVARKNRDDLYLAKELSKQYDEQNKKVEEANNLKLQGIRNRIYDENGLDTEKQGYWSLQVAEAQEQIVKSEKEREKFEYASLQHINEHVTAMKEAGVSEKDRVKYITEYSTKAEEAAQHLKEFNQGELTSGVYYLMDRLSLMWIDLWNDQHFINFWNSLKDTWNDVKPTVDAITKSFGDLGHTLLDFFSTKPGQIIGGIALFGAAIGGLGIKFYHVLGGAKSTIDIFKTLGGKLKDIGKSWKNAGDEAEKAAEKMGGKTSTGGITGDTGTTAKTPFKETLKSDVQKYARAAVGIAAIMGLVTEAIILLKLPMGALANVGQQFKSQEPQLRAGIDGLKLIAPVMAVLLPPVIALTVIMGKFDKVISTSTILKGAGKAAVGIAAGMLLVAEAIAMVIPSIWALGALGGQYQGMEAEAKKGAEAMKLVADSLNYLKPFIPVLAIAIGSIALLFSGGGSIVGGIAIISITLGIAAGMLWIAEAIRGLEYPLQEIGNLGSKFSDLSNVRQGAEAMKVTAEAMTYVEEGTRALTLIKWEEIGSYIADLVGRAIGVDLTQLSGEGGFFDQLEEFTRQFNQINLEKIDTAKVATLSESATGIDSVKTALNTVKDALKDLPDFETDNRSTNEKYQDAVSGTTTTEGISNYFEQLKQPIEQLNEFIDHFNTEINVVDVDPDKIAVISRSAEAIGTINSAIENVKTAMGNAVDAQWNANMASGGILGAAAGYLIGDGNPNASSLKSGLDELYNSVKDIMDFNTKIAGLTSTGSGNTEGVTNASNMVSALQTEINNLKTTLSGAIPTVKSAAKDMGASIVTGVKDGVSTLSSDISPSFDTMVTTVTDYGTKASDGFKEKFKLKDTVSTEIDNALSAFDGKEDEFYNKGKLLGDAFQRGYKDGGGINSPGYAAQAAQQEIGYIEQYIQDGINNVPQKAFELANLISSNMTFDLGLSNLQLPDITDFQNRLSTLIPTVDNVKIQVSNGFNTMKTNIGNSLTGLSLDATTKYGQIVSTTRNSLTNMQSQTTKNIGAIRTSWAAMQTALIASAENIRSETSSKINTLKDNMASFWQKIRNPELLISGSAGPAQGGKGSIRRRSMPRSGFAGSNGIPSRSQSLFPTIRSRNSPDDMLSEYLKCILTTGKPCYAGGWDFNWSPDISRRFKKWDTHFAKYHLDDFLKVGSFENNNFPVKGRADVAKQYIYDVISGTKYGDYFDSKFGEDPVAALRAGVFNCWDGTNIILAIARAFGFYGSRGHGTWNGIGHVWASIPGLGIIDPTAIQNGYGFTSPKVSGYAGSIRRGGGNVPPTGDNNTYNTNVEIHVHGDDVSVNDQKIDDSTGKKIIDLLGISPSTGR